MNKYTTLQVDRFKVIAVIIMAVMICLSMFPENAFAANQINYSGGSNIDDTATVNANKVEHLQSIHNSSHSLIQAGGWISASYQGKGELFGKALSISPGTKTYSDTYLLYPNEIVVNGEYYDVKVSLKRTINLTDKDAMLFAVDGRAPGFDAWPSPYTGAINNMNNGFFANFDIDIIKHGTNEKLNLSELYFKYADLDYHQSFSSNNIDLSGGNLLIKAKGLFQGRGLDGSATGVAYVNESGIYSEPWCAIDSAGYDPDVYVNVSNLDTYNLTYGWKSSAGSGIWFLTTKHTVTYESINGSVTGRQSEQIITGLNPTGSDQSPNTGYCHTAWKPNVNVQLKDGTTISAGSTMTMEQIKNVVVNQDMTFTAYNEPYRKVNYEWEGDHPNISVPTGESNIYPGDEYTVDTSYKTGDTVYEENALYNGKTYPRGTWVFKGWDKNGILTINEDTTIYGKWELQPEWNVETEVINGTITPTENNIPEGQNRTVTYQPNPDHQLKELTVDGENKDISEYPVSFSFENITADHKVKAVYEKIPVLENTKNADKEIYNAGDTVTYTVTVKQTKEGAEARDVTVKDTLPEGVTLNEDSIQGDVKVVSTSANSYELLISSITNEVTYTYTAVTAKGMDAEELINIVNSSGKNVPVDPPEARKKIKSLTPKAAVTKIVSNETPIYGEEITYTISVKEPQEGIALRNAVVTDEIPKGIEYVDGSIKTAGDEATASVEGNKITVSIPALNDETVITFKAKVVESQGRIVNTAVLTGDDIEELKADAPVTVKEPEPTLTKTVSSEKTSVGDTVTYTLTAASKITLTDGKLVDTPPEGVEIIADTVQCSDKSMRTSVEGNILTIEYERLSEQITISYKAKISKAGELVNTAALTAGNFPKGPLESKARVKAKEPVPVIEKTVNKGTLKKSDTATYTLTAYTSEGTLYDAVIEDVLPDGMSLVPGSISTSGVEAVANEEGNKITIKADMLGQEKLIITYSAKATKDGKHKNVAILTGSNYTDEPLQDEATTNVESPKNVGNSPKMGDNINVICIVMAGILMLTTIAISASLAAKRRKSKN